MVVGFFRDPFYIHCLVSSLTTGILAALPNAKQVVDKKCSNTGNDSVVDSGRKKSLRERKKSLPRTNVTHIDELRLKQLKLQMVHDITDAQKKCRFAKSKEWFRMAESSEFSCRIWFSKMRNDF